MWVTLWLLPHPLHQKQLLVSAFEWTFSKLYPFFQLSCLFSTRVYSLSQLDVNRSGSKASFRRKNSTYKPKNHIQNAMFSYFKNSFWKGNIPPFTPPGSACGYKMHKRFSAQVSNDSKNILEHERVEHEILTI